VPLVTSHTEVSLPNPSYSDCLRLVFSPAGAGPTVCNTSAAVPNPERLVRRERSQGAIHGRVRIVPDGESAAVHRMPVTPTAPIIDPPTKLRHHSSRMSASRQSLLLAVSILLACAIASAGEKNWIEVRSPHFRVLSDGGDHDARRVAREFEQMRAVFASGFPSFRLDSGAPLLVLAPRDESSMKALAPQIWKRKGAKPAGFFQNGWEKQFAVVQLDEVRPGAYMVVYHEYTHSLLHMNSHWLPIWLDEGLAEFYGSTRFEQTQTFVGAPSPRFQVLVSRTLIPIATLIAVNQPSPYYHDEDKVQMFYAEAWALTHYLIFGPEMAQGKKLIEFFALVQAGMEQTKAFQEVFGNPKDMDAKLDQYVHKVAMPTWVGKNPPPTDEKAFTARTLRPAETKAELGGYHLWSRDLVDAKPLIEEALKNDPKLALAHEDMGFVDFEEGKDEDAAREFAQAYELDDKQYLSLFYRTMLSPIAHSDVPTDQGAFRDALLKTIHLNRQFAPAYVELARLAVRQGNLTVALSIARKAEQLEPSRAGYHLLSGQIMLRLGRGSEAATSAKYVADRWFGPDHDEALELWNSVPTADKPAGDPPSEVPTPGTQAVGGRLTSANCGEKESIFGVDHDGQKLTFRSAGGWFGGYSDTLWFAGDHFSFCHHTEGLRAVVRYKPSPDQTYAGDLTEIELREDLPASPPATAEKQKP